jgi:integrase
MRRGEAVGLCWSQVDLTNRALSVRQSMLSVRYQVLVDKPKTSRSSRTIALDPITVAVLQRLLQQQGTQQQILGSAWHQGDYVFTREDGSPWHPEYVSKRFSSLVKSTALPRIRLHDLRHTHASLALRGGVHLKVMQERLGHSSISVTANMYSHVAPGLQHDAAARIADLALGSWEPPLANG